MPVGISHAVDALVMGAHDVGDLRVVVDVAEDPLADLGVLLHLPALLEGQRARFLEQAGRQPDLSDVVDEAAKVDELLLILGQRHTLSDVSRVDRHGRGVTSGVLISRVERGDEGSCKGKARSPEPFIRSGQVLAHDLFLLVELQQALSRECGQEEDEDEL